MVPLLSLSTMLKMRLMSSSEGTLFASGAMRISLFQPAVRTLCITA
jgi:hypothetical protein